MIKFYSEVLNGYVTPVFRKDYPQSHINRYTYLCIETPHNYLKDILGDCAYKNSNRSCTDPDANFELKFYSELWKDNVDNYVCSGPKSKIYGFIKVESNSIYSKIWMRHHDCKIGTI